MKPEMMHAPRVILLGVGGLLLSACVHFPTGPSVMVLPGSAKSFAQFQTDDTLCRDWALHQSEATPRQAATATGVNSAVVGTVVGAAAGAAIGAASGHPGEGAVVGAGTGLTLGALAGASRSGGTLQRRYDDAYIQCMYANGNQIPLPRGAFATSPPAQPPPSGSPLRVPPPPAGAPPPPPPRAS